MIALLVLLPLHSQMIDHTTPRIQPKKGSKSPLINRSERPWEINTKDSSLFIINRDPFRSIRRGRQLFQRKFTRAQGAGPITGDGGGDVAADKSIGAGFADSCAACHGRPRGSAGFGGDVVTRPDSRDAPHLFGLGLKEMLADEITAGIRKDRDEAVARPGNP